jgi:1-aminocyclopropane-1-carboxylate deaminase/D-cysteine desulfhydrase-like pyridoxal-dependent ACC family enzyme
LATLPTPIVRLDGLTRRLHGEIWIKRDDLSAPLYGGNKVRKLEYLLGAAQARGVNRVWTLGGAGSHHVLAVSLYARRLGLQSAAVTFPQPRTTHTARVSAAIAQSGCRLFAASSRAQVPLAGLRLWHWTLLQRWRKSNSAPVRTCHIPAGGSSPLGALGYVHAGLELAAQIEAGVCPPPRTIVVALGSCGTTAGLLAGLEIAGHRCTIHAVRVADRPLANAFNVYRLAWGALRLLARTGRDPFALKQKNRWPPPWRPGFRGVKLTVVPNQLGYGYGHPTSAGQRAIHLLQTSAGLTLDPTYTAKAFAHILDSRIATPASPGKANRTTQPVLREPILYWHTLGDVEKL